MRTFGRYRTFGECEARGESLTYERLAVAVANDAQLLDLLDELRWLDALIWPEQQHRWARLHAAASIARADPPHLVRGDLLADLPALAAQAPAEAALVVFHSAVLAYVPPETRAAFAELVHTLPGHWISNGGLRVLPDLAATVCAPAGSPSTFLLALDGQPLAFTAPHGQRLQWLDLEDQRS
ncbi:MAG TPA: DUF2332 family protein [Micromonospora sp.]|nr:DUF2332 family protein [Micromonospora sp.]